MLIRVMYSIPQEKSDIFTHPVVGFSLSLSLSLFLYVFILILLIEFSME